jgi:hypothetical protein
MAATPQYSTLFTCLYDEPEPIGHLGRGTHYSIMRTAEWLDVTRKPLAKPEVHDFAVIWDEDHDVRVIEAVERIYMAGLLSPVQFIGERKGSLTVIVAARFYFSGSGAEIKAYERALNDISQDLEDSWPTTVGSFDRSPISAGLGWHQTFAEGLISAEEHRVNLYLTNIDSLWKLGTRPYVLPKRAGPPPATLASIFGGDDRA